MLVCEYLQLPGLAVSMSFDCFCSSFLVALRQRTWPFPFLLFRLYIHVVRVAVAADRCFDPYTEFLV